MPALNLADFEEAARRRLPRALFEYVQGGAEDNQSRDANRHALQRLSLVPRVLRDVSQRSCDTTLLGERWSAPFGIAPMGLAGLIAHRGDLALAHAAMAENVPSVTSATSLMPMEEIAAAAPRSWFQAYLSAEPARIRPMLDRAAAAGYRTLVVTVDVPVTANRENLARHGFSTPLRPSLRLAWDGISHPRWLAGVLIRTVATRGMPHFENSQAARGAPLFARHAERDFGQREALDWRCLGMIRNQWRGQLIVKGILAAEDVRLAREAGADAVILSNHGGRQLDGATTAIDALPSAMAIAGDLPVLIDGGFRRGSDVLKALAIGARFVFVGRPFLHAAAAAGETGVRHAIRLLRAEVDRNMAMLGVTRPDEVGPSHLCAGQ